MADADAEEIERQFADAKIGGSKSFAHINVTSLKLFSSVVEHSNIAKASRDNNIAASAVSKRVSDLEARIGVALLYRVKDGVEPTPAGRALVRHVERILRLMDDMGAELSEYAAGNRGQVRLWANTSAVTQFLPEDLIHYLERYPEVGVELREETSGLIVDAVRDGFADIGIFSEHVPAGVLQTRIYRRDKLMVIMPVGHELACRQSLKMYEISKHDHVGLQDGSSLQDKLKQAAASLNIKVRFRVKVLSFDGIRRMVEAGLGLAVLPEGAIVPYLQAGSFVAAQLDEPWATRTLTLGYRDFSSLPVIARELVQCLAPDDERHGS
jgi:DNA-binding transcriptional LysR family regulator